MPTTEKCLTNDADHHGRPEEARCTDAERDYLLTFASRYFATPVTAADVVWTYSGVRPLYDDGATSATAATRDYVLALDAGEIEVFRRHTGRQAPRAGGYPEAGAITGRQSGKSAIAATVAATSSGPTTCSATE